MRDAGDPVQRAARMHLQRLQDFQICMRVFVPPNNSSYVVKLCINPQLLRRNNSASRPAGGRSKASGVGQLLENGARKRRKKKGVAE
ncbi:g7790 [Coccomyxa elongata]